MKTKMAIMAVALMVLAGCNTAHTQYQAQPFDWGYFGAGMQQMGAGIYNNTEAYRRAKVQAKANALGLAASGDRNTQVFGGGYGYNPFSAYRPRPVYGAGNGGAWMFGR